MSSEEQNTSPHFEELEASQSESFSTGSSASSLLDIELDARLQFGAREMLLADLLELGSGDILELDRQVTDPIDLLVGDRIVARGEVVVVNGNFAFQVTEVVAPQLRLESVRCLL